MNKVLLGDVAEEVRENYKETDGNPAVVGLEHLIPGEIRLKEWSEDTNTTFTKAFHKGQVLFGRRRAYLKKAAVAPVDGICSGDITVISAKQDKILPELLPFVIQNDDFFDFAVGKSAGSLSPRVKWSRLKEYEFNLPSLPQQRKLAKLLWSFVDAKEAYEDLIHQTDELAKSQFIEMFGSEKDNVKDYPVLRIGDFSECYPGATPSTKKNEYWDGGDIPWMSSGEVYKEHIYDTEQKITIAGYKNASTKMVPPHSIVVALAGQGRTRGTVAINEIELCTNQSLCAIIPDEHVILTDYLFQDLKNRYEELRDMSTVPGGRGGLSLTIINKVPVLVPPLELQKVYVDMIYQSDKSKFELNEAIKDLDAMYKRIIKDNLG